MIKKYRNVCLILIFSIIAVFNALSIDFDNVVDFSVNLKALSILIENGQEDELDRNKYYVLNGIYSSISPKIINRNYFFYLNKEDLINPSSFINKIEAGSTGLTVYLKQSLTQETMDMLNSSSGVSDELIAAVLDDISDLIKKESIYSSSNFTGISLSDELIEIIDINPQITEEIVFLNRLLLEAAFPDEIWPEQLELELVYGEWIGTDDVIGYKCILIVNGAQAFRIFNRLKTEEASSLIIPINSKIMVVAKPVRVITLNGERVWELEAYYIRKI